MGGKCVPKSRTEGSVDTVLLSLSTLSPAPLSPLLPPTHPSLFFPSPVSPGHLGKYVSDFQVQHQNAS